MPFLGTTGGGSVKQYGGQQANLGYFIKNSLRLRSSAGGYLVRTLGTPTNTTAFTLSFWVKRGKLGSQQQLVLPGLGGSGVVQGNIEFLSDDTIHYWGYNGSAMVFELTTTQVFRDPAAWYHIVALWDSANATSSSRVRLYVNGSQVSSFSTATYPSQNASNATIAWNTAIAHYISRADTYPMDCYVAEINFVDGQALTPSSFGKTNAATNQWIPKKFAGTYGTNGFYLKFADASAATAAAIGKDSSGNGNNWTPNNISVTAGATYDAMIDSPSLSGAASNYWTFNPLIPVSGATYSNGNLQYTNSNNNKSGFSSPLPTTGKWYWEGTWITNGGGSSPIIGISQAGFDITQGGSGELGYRSNGNKFDQSGTETAYGATWTTGDVIGVAVDMDGGTIVFYKNGTSQGTAFTTVLTALTQPVSPMFRVNVAGDVLAINFGQRPFTYTPPSGFVALNTFNLP